MKNNGKTNTDTHSKVSLPDLYLLCAGGLAIGFLLFGGNAISKDRNFLVRAAADQPATRTEFYRPLNFDSATEAFGGGDEEESSEVGQSPERTEEPVQSGERPYKPNKITDDINRFSSDRGGILLDGNSSGEAGQQDRGAGETRMWQKRDTGADVNAIIAHASRVSGHDIDFISTLDKENAGTWSIDVMNWNKNGTYDKGICQFNSQYFMHIINDPEFSNPEWQVNRCLELYRGWEARGILHLRFFAYPNRGLSKVNFYFVE